MKEIELKVCACGIAAVDCEYHKPAKVARVSQTFKFYKEKGWISYGPPEPF